MEDHLARLSQCEAMVNVNKALCVLALSKDTHMSIGIVWPVASQLSHPGCIVGIYSMCGPSGVSVDGKGGGVSERGSEVAQAQRAQNCGKGADLTAPRFHSLTHSLSQADTHHHQPRRHRSLHLTSPAQTLTHVSHTLSSC